MASPFVGMDPYLEHPDRWSTVHHRLIVALADVLTPQLLPRYQVDIEKHTLSEPELSWMPKIISQQN